MFKKLMIAASLLASTSAFATSTSFTITDPNPDSSFAAGTYAFLDISSLTNFDLSLAFTTSKNLTNINLFNGSTSSVVSATGTKDTGYSFSLTNLLAGTYQLRFNVASGGTLTGNYTASPVVTTPVPEPESYGMILAGMALIGAIAFRRQKSI